MSERIHIVGTELADTRILARLARLLASGNGWSLSEKPDPTAEANVFLPYLLVPKNGWEQTPSAAWFTHREAHLEPKDRVWKRADSQVGMRVTSAAMWLEHLGQPSALAIPPLDRSLYTPGPRPKRPRHLRPLIGTSGFVYVGGRKGEKLWRSLVTQLRSRAEFTATGRGWGASTRYLARPADVLPFYRSLDLYVCTALVEGVPYGPLEALACGIPIVIPRSVGLLDSLPEMDGVTRYVGGDAESLRQAVKAALAALAQRRPDSEQLRSATEPFTDAAWCAGWTAAIERLLSGEPEQAQEAGADGERPLEPSADGKRSDSRPGAAAPLSRATAPAPMRPAVTRGVVCVAYGEPARKCARTLIASVRRYLPGTPVCLIADEPLGIEDVHAYYPDADLGARSAKTSLYDLAPAEWASVLYLDADTWLCSSGEPIFRVLEDGWDVVMTTDPSKYSLAKHGVRPDNKDEARETFGLVGTDEFLQLNGGVCGFRRSPGVAAFFADWHREWLVYAKRDQMAFDRALYRNPLRVWLLGRPFNQIVRYGAPSRSTVIAHAPITARRWVGIVQGRLDSPQARRLAEVGFSRHPEPPAGLKVAR